MAPERLNRVLVALGRGTIELPWASRVALLAEARQVDALRPVVAKFEGVGSSRPATLTLEEKDALLAGVVEPWLERVGTDGLPAGILALRNTLHDDLHDAGEAS